SFRRARSRRTTVEQDKIDVTRATPVSNSGTTGAKRGAPMWLQLLLSLIVIVIAVGVAALFNPTANDLVKRVGIGLPLLTGSSDDTPAAAPQAQGQGRQGQAAGQQQTAAQGQGGGQRQGQGCGAGRPGGAFAGARTAVVVTAPVTS